ncbi:hypothetical protein AVEN_17930-1 [Araneus ventricosus]|uniref:Uncharacterized protein n=1 Tax=Araneus ventricosus TaxID=182803 RepID=A0A4Y2G1A4_ARAVE|nr:hypothetical protein AVEN_17930-1 [Araneus ventricosus]
MEDKTGSVFHGTTMAGCAMEEDTTKYEWMAQLSPFNTVFQEELLATQEACLGQSRPTNSLRAHVGYSGGRNSQEGNTGGNPTYIPAPRNYIKSLLQKESIIRWQNGEWYNGGTGRSVYNVLLKVKITPTPWQSPSSDIS